MRAGVEFPAWPALEQWRLFGSAAVVAMETNILFRLGGGGGSSDEEKDGKSNPHTR